MGRSSWEFLRVLDSVIILSTFQVLLQGEYFQGRKSGSWSAILKDS